MLLESGDKVYLYGTGEVKTCSHSCSKQGPQNLGNSSISYFTDTQYSFRSRVRTLGSFLNFEPSTAYLTSFRVKTGGILNLAIIDGSLTTISNSNYEDNSGVFGLDIFVIDPDQEEGFNRFRDALFEANPDDENAKAYLGKR